MNNATASMEVVKGQQALLTMAFNAERERPGSLESDCKADIWGPRTSKMKQTCSPWVLWARNDPRYWEMWAIPGWGFTGAEQFGIDIFSQCGGSNPSNICRWNACLSIWPVKHPWLAFEVNILNATNEFSLCIHQPISDVYWGERWEITSFPDQARH